MASEQSKKPLRIAAKIDDRDFFEKEIQPYIKEYSSIIEPSDSFSEKCREYGEASYFIYPIQWEEPFGLVFLEAMVCGTPIIAFAKGSVPEIVKDGVTGFIVNSSDNDIRGDWIVKKTGIDGLCEAIERIYSMPKNEYLKMRQNCRRHVEENFTLQKTVDEYEKLYKNIASKFN